MPRNHLKLSSISLLWVRNKKETNMILLVKLNNRVGLSIILKELYVQTDFFKDLVLKGIYHEYTWGVVLNQLNYPI